MSPRVGRLTIALLTGFAVAAAGCAPIARYAGPEPAPGAVRTHAASVLVPAPSGDSRRLALEDAESAGRAAVDPGGARTRDTLTVLIYGDNRPGFRMEQHFREYRAVSRMFSGGLGRFGLGLVALPLFLIEAVVPTLDGPRDLITVFTKHPMAGGERRVLEAMAAQLPADLVISTGDVVTDGRRGRLWDDFVARHRTLREQALYLATPGNHERLHDPRSRSNWDVAIGDPPRAQRYWYEADLPAADARFVFLDSNLLTDARDQYPDSLERALADEQLDWADRSLAAPARYKIVVLHHPPITTGHHARNWAAKRPADPVPERRARLLELCAQHGVTALIAGHEHLYQRFYVAGPTGGFWQVITGGGGAPLYPIERGALERELEQPLPSGLSVVRKSARGAATFHFCRVRFLPESGAEPPPLEMEAYRVAAGGRAELLDRVDLAADPRHLPAAP